MFASPPPQRAAQPPKPQQEWGRRDANFSTYGFDNSNDSLLALNSVEMNAAVFLCPHSSSSPQRKGILSQCHFTVGRYKETMDHRCRWISRGWLLVCWWRMRDSHLETEETQPPGSSSSVGVVLCIVLIADWLRRHRTTTDRNSRWRRHSQKMRILLLYAPWANYLSTFMISVKTRFCLSPTLPNELINYSHFYSHAPISYYLQIRMDGAFLLAHFRHPTKPMQGRRALPRWNK